MPHELIESESKASKGKLDKHILTNNKITGDKQSKYSTMMVLGLGYNIV